VHFETLITFKPSIHPASTTLYAHDKNVQQILYFDDFYLMLFGREN